MPETPPAAQKPAAEATHPPFPYRRWPFIVGHLSTPAGEVPQISTGITCRDILGRWQMRWGLGRSRYRVAPGLYAIGNPDAQSPVLVTANYKMTVDALRSTLAGFDGWLLVLDTRGINVWCAAGKGTFGTDEVVRRVEASRVAEVVTHRTLILPQLGAPGVAAHEVRRQCGFKVVYGPVRAGDLMAFLSAGLRATPEMRRVRFTALERLILTPVELTGMLKISLWAAITLFVLAGIQRNFFTLPETLSRGTGALLVYAAGLLAGAVATPVLLPWIPGRAFAFKGALAGLASACGALAVLGSEMGRLNSAALLLALPAVASWCAMNFTGSTTFTSPSGVEKEMRRAIPLQAAALLAAGICWIAGAF